MNRRGFLQFLSAAPVAVAAAAPAALASTRFASGGFVGGHVDLGLAGESFRPIKYGISRYRRNLSASDFVWHRAVGIDWPTELSVAEQMKAHDVFEVIA